jgi:hypothetical protein
LDGSYCSEGIFKECGLVDGAEYSVIQIVQATARIEELVGEWVIQESVHSKVASP